MRAAAITSWVLMLLLMINSARAHEVQGNRITVVVRDGHAIDIVLRLDMLGTLQHMMAPDSQPQEFLVAVVAQGPDALESALGQLRESVEHELLLKSRGAVLPIQQWQWPTAVDIHAALRQQFMSGMVATEAVADVVPLEVHATASDLLPVERLSLAIPALAKPAVVVWYEPKQAILGNESELELEF